MTPGVFYRVRVFSEGRGWQVREYEDLVSVEEDVTIEVMSRLVREAVDGFTEAVIEAHEATRDLADDAGGLPPGVSYGDPTGLVVIIEPMQGLMDALNAA